jgi:type IV pilus assembly protein PilB
VAQLSTLGGKATLMKFGAEIVDLTQVDFTPELLRCIPADVARKYRVLPVSDLLGRLSIALADPEDFNTIDSLIHILKKPELEIRIADEQQLDIFLQRLYGD